MQKLLLYLMTNTMNALISQPSSRLYLYYLNGLAKLLQFIFATLHLTIDNNTFEKNKICVLLTLDRTLAQRISPQNLNSIIADGDEAGLSALWWLTANPPGRQFLTSDSTLRHKITQEGLNSIGKNGDHVGVSALYMLSADKDGLEILADDYVRLMIREDGLNNVRKNGAYQGDSALYWLARKQDGLKLLAQDSNLRGKITEVGLNSIIQNQDEEGMSALYFLATRGQGRKLLEEDSNLRGKITEVGLNSIIQNQDEEGMSALYWLANYHGGSKLIAQDSNLRGKITKAGLNSVIQNGKRAGESALFWLAAYDEDGLLLEKDKALCGKVTKEGLNSIVQCGEMKGTSSLFWLSGNPEGRKLLAKDKELRQKITPEGLNRIVQYGKDIGTSALWWLTKTKVCIEMLTRDSALREKITSEGLNSIVDHGEYDGISPLYFLALHSAIVQVIARDKDRDPNQMITEEGLNSVVKKGDCAGSSALFWVAGKSDNRQILYREGIRQKINPQGLNSIMPNGESALFWLVSQAETVTLLNKNDLRQKVTEVGLNSIIQDGERAGESALFWLVSQPETVALLKQDDLRQKITEAGLNSIIQDGAYAGESALFWIAADPVGRQLLVNDSELRKKIKPEGLNSIARNTDYAGMSALYQLVVDANSRSILKNDERLRAMMIDGIRNHLHFGGAYLIDLIAKLQKDPELRQALDDKELILSIKNEISAMESGIISSTKAKTVLNTVFHIPKIQHSLNRVELKSIMNKCLNTLSSNDKWSIVQTWAHDTKGQAILKAFTDYAPSMLPNEFKVPECIDADLQTGSIIQSDPITRACIVNPVYVLSQPRTGDSQDTRYTGPFEYEVIYYHLLRTGKNPTTNTVVIRRGQNPNDVIDQSRLIDQERPDGAHEIKTAIAQWLNKNIRKMVTIERPQLDTGDTQAMSDSDASCDVTYLLAVLHDRAGLHFLLSLPEVMANLVDKDFAVSLTDLPEWFLASLVALYPSDIDASRQQTTRHTLWDILYANTQGRELLALLPDLKITMGAPNTNLALSAAGMRPSSPVSIDAREVLDNDAAQNTNSDSSTLEESGFFADSSQSSTNTAPNIR